MTIIILPLSAQLLEQAEKAAAEGSRETAADIYREWLTGNRDDPLYVETLYRYLEISPDISETLVFLHQELRNPLQTPVRHELLVVTGEFLEMKGELEKARNTYSLGAAIEEETGLQDFRCRLSAARMEIEMGRVDESRERLEKIVRLPDEPEAANSAYVLLSLALFSSGDNAEAESILSMLLEKNLLGGLAPQELYTLLYISTGLKKSEEREKISAILHDRYGGSPEEELSEGSSRVHLQPNPLFLFNLPGREEGGTGQDEGGGRVRVQTGLFSLLKNAEELAGRLEKSGFSAEIVEDQAEGKNVYRVLSPLMKAEEYDHYIISLKDSGFEAFLYSSE